MGAASSQRVLDSAGLKVRDLSRLDVGGLDAEATHVGAMPP